MAIISKQVTHDEILLLLYNAFKLPLFVVIDEKDFVFKTILLKILDFN